jgi:hypothetical protein
MTGSGKIRESCIDAPLIGSDGASQPSYGLGDVPGGSFMGVGISFATCLIPPPLQPAIPPGGLFGPDMPTPPMWRFPGYTPPPDITSPHGDGILWTHHGPLPGVRPRWWPLGTMGAGMMGRFPNIDPGFDPTMPMPWPSIEDIMGGADTPSTLPNMPGFRSETFNSDQMLSLYIGKLEAEAGRPIMRGTLTISSTSGGAGGGHPKLQTITTNTMSWGEYNSYQKGGSNWGGNKPSTPGEHTGGYWAHDDMIERVEPQAHFNFVAAEAYVRMHKAEADMWNAEATAVLWKLPLDVAKWVGIYVGISAIAWAATTPAASVFAPDIVATVGAGGLYSGSVLGSCGEAVIAIAALAGVAIYYILRFAWSILAERRVWEEIAHEIHPREPEPVGPSGIT